jgi:hypothetical protein
MGTNCSRMKIASEIYKGIEFVRISSLDANEKMSIWQTIEREKIIKILRDNELLSDCIQYHDYVSWTKKNQNHSMEQLA